MEDKGGEGGWKREEKEDPSARKGDRGMIKKIPEQTGRGRGGEGGPKEEKRVQRVKKQYSFCSLNFQS